MATIYVYDEIGPAYWGLIGAQTVADALEGIGKDEPLTVRINSPGGSVWEALTMRRLFAEHAGPVRFRIDAIAASAATLLPPTLAPVEIAKGGRYMIHDPWTMVAGNAKELREAADRLDGTKGDILDIYEARVDGELSRQELSEFMDNETLFNAQEALAAGFVDEIDDEGERIAACWRPGVFSKRLDELFAQEPTDQSRPVARQEAAARRARRGTSLEQDRLARATSPAFWDLLNRR